MDKVKIRIKSVCGAQRAYGIGAAAEQFMRLIRPRKTFDNIDLDAIQELGFELEIETVKMEEVIIKQ